MKEFLQVVEQQYLTKAQACAYVGLSERSIDYARVEGGLTFYKFGKRVLFKKSDLDSWMERHRAGANLNQIVDDVMADLGDR